MAWGVGWNSLALHVLQAMDAVVVVYLPGEQATQEMDPVVLVYFPDGHTV